MIDQLLEVAATNGVAGRLQVAETSDEENAAVPATEPPHDPRFDAAADAIEKGDFTAAAGAYRSMLADSPADPEAKAGLAQVELLQRVDAADRHVGPSRGRRRSRPMSAPSSPRPTSTSPTGRSTMHSPGWSTPSGG